MAQGMAQQPGTGPRPRTYVGLWLHANMRQDFNAADRLGRQLNGGLPGWNKDEPAVVKAAAELAVRRFFSPEYDVREVTTFVSDMRARITSKIPPGQLEMEAVIRAALGETDVVLAGIRPSVLLDIRGSAIANVVVRLALGESEIDQMVADAERIAFERGWSPPLAD